ncbi:ubiquinone biosynthesis accessory factor UbiJ [Salinicola avicenniae]|uniref:ubiquinone biosynthesis accessory factor UbiJ n=1 Tax=Salinicola avicenniae TaxID=2916836 RepID=UPI0020731B64|nr:MULTISPECIES: SCP2 sterol-binding domain-containing protein [unclassified Salinicola]
MLDTFLLVALERAINPLLARDPATPARLAALSGKTLRLTFHDAELALRLRFHDDGLSLERVRDWQARDDLTLALDATALRRLVAGDSLERLMFSGQLSVSGEVGLLTPIQALFLDFDLDWEGALAKGLGNGTAHGIAAGLRHLIGQARFLQREWQQDMREYLFEERRWLAGRDQLAVARDHLTELQQGVDRLAARVARLERWQERRS